MLRTRVAATPVAVWEGQTGTATTQELGKDVMSQAGPAFRHMHPDDKLVLQTCFLGPDLGVCKPKAVVGRFVCAGCLEAAPYTSLRFPVTLRSWCHS